MLRLSLIFLASLSLAACAPARDMAEPRAFGESATKGQVRSAEALRLGSVGGRILTVAAELCDRYQAPAGCDYPLLVSNEGEANAFTDGRRIRVTRHLVRFAESDAELAFTVAHEVAHNLLGHKRRALFGGDPKRLEFDADKLGLELAARAGYDPNAAVTLLRRLAAADPGRNRPNPRYPSFTKRAEVLKDLADDLVPRISEDKALSAERPD